MRFGRRRKEITIKLSSREVSEAVERAQARRPEVQRSTRLRVRVSDAGRVRARMSTSGRYHARPHLRGRIVPTELGTSFQGVIYESYVESLIPGLFAALALFMALATIVVAVSGGGPGIVICAVAAVVFALLAYKLGESRPTSFAIDAKELDGAVRRVIQH